MTLLVFNSNITKNIKFFYYTSDFVIDYILIFFSLVFEVYFNGFPKKFTFKIVISIYLKYINNNLVIVLIIYGDFQSG